MKNAKKQKEKMKLHSQLKRKPLRVNDKKLLMDEINNHDTIEERDSSSLSRFGARDHQQISRSGVTRAP
jgi:hypothetical protein